MLGRIALVAFVATSCFGIARGGALYPDTFAFASGSSAWSSPLQALAGHAAGIRGVQWVALTSLVALGVVLWRRARPIWLVILSIGPWAVATGCAGADAAGALVVVLAVVSGRSRCAPLAVGAHLAAGLAAAAALTGQLVGIPFRYGLALAAIAELAIMRAQLLGSSSFPTELQWRYLLPAVAVLSLRPRSSADSIAMTPESETAASQGDRFESFDAMRARRARYSTE